LARPADRHLTQDELEALVSPSALKRGELSSSGNDPGEVASHMTQCEKCRSLAGRYSVAEERLASLRSGGDLPRQDHCPVDEEWLSVAAGLLPAERFENYMNHAANCDHCATLLREAVADFADELKPLEEDLIAGLASSTPEWQRRFALGLRDGQFPEKASPPPGYRWRTVLGAVLRPSYLALAASLILLFVLGIRIGRWKERSDAQIAQANAVVERLRQELAQQQSRNFQLTSQLGSANAPDASTEHYAKGLAAFWVLEPELARGTGGQNRLKLPADSQFISIMLRFTQLPSKVLRVELVTIDRKPIWSQESEASADELKSGNLFLMIPAHLLAPGDYQIVVSRQSSDGLEELATYTFRVAR
jgi:hypothetical protein